MQNITSSPPTHQLAQQSTPMKSVDLDISVNTHAIKQISAAAVLEDPLEVQSMGSATSTEHTTESRDPHVWDRTQFLGGSDIGAILGLSSFRSAVDVWLEKTQGTNSQADSLIFRFGHFAEDFIAKEYERATGRITHSQDISLTHEHYPYLWGHVDRWVVDANSTTDQHHLSSAVRILECKTSHPQQAHLWGEPGSDQVPMAYYVQCAWYMMLANCPICDVAVLIGNNDFRIYTLHQDPELEKFLLESAIHFWEQHVLTRISPEPRSEDDCRKLFSKVSTAKKVEAPHTLVKEIEHFHAIQTMIKEKEALASEIKQLIMKTLGDADTLTYQGKILATWKAPKPSIKTNFKQLELDHPEWLTPYQSTQEASRRLLIKELV
jgi:putative phage-type endonuclease